MLALGRFIFITALVLSVEACGGIVVYPDDEANNPITTADSGSSERTSSETDDDGPEQPDDDEDDDEGVDCGGAFGQPELLFEDVGWMPQALSPTKDALEFYYARGPLGGGARDIVVRRRSSLGGAWSEPESLPEIEGLCETVAPEFQVAALDVSGDGLRLYVGCNSFAPGVYPNGPLFVAVRADRSSPFVVIPEPVGFIGISIGISRDELTAFGTSRDPAIGHVLMYKRSSIFEAFGEATVVPGAPELTNPEPAPGDLLLMGVESNHLVVVERPALDQPFGVMNNVGLPMPSGTDRDVSPALGADCRTLYFTRRSVSPAKARVMVAYR